MAVMLFEGLLVLVFFKDPLARMKGETDEELEARREEAKGASAA
jgi:hypothetical protein